LTQYTKKTVNSCLITQQDNCFVIS